MTDDNIDELTDIVPHSVLSQHEQEYNTELQQRREVSHQTQFTYAWCLIRSRYQADIHKGILLLEELFAKNPEGKRDYYYYLAVGHARIRQYSMSLKYIKEFLSIEPQNQQVRVLEKKVKERMTREGLTGMAVAGGIVVGLAAGLVGLGMALSKK